MVGQTRFSLQLKINLNAQDLPAKEQAIPTIAMSSLLCLELNAVWRFSFNW